MCAYVCTPLSAVFSVISQRQKNGFRISYCAALIRQSLSLLLLHFHPNILLCLLYNLDGFQLALNLRVEEHSDNKSTQSIPHFHMKIKARQTQSTPKQVSSLWAYRPDRTHS